MSFLALCFCGGGMGMNVASGSEEALLLSSYIDDFSTEKARYDSYDNSVFWVYGSYPPEHPYLAYASVDNNEDGLIFRGHDKESAILAYKLPINPDTQDRCGSMTVRIEIDFGLLGNEDPGNPRVGYLNYQFSSDGVDWSDTKNLSPPGEHAIEGALEEFRYLKFKGMHALLSSLRVDVYLQDPAIVVPDDYTTIQAAINAATDGDVIMVRPGYYFGEGFVNLSFSGHVGHRIILMSQEGPGTCSIDCQNGAQGFIFNSGEGRDIIIDGFTIYNGRASRGGAISCVESSPTIANCVLSDNDAVSGEEDALGGAIYCYGGSPLIRDCKFKNNRADQGGALYIGGASEAKVIRGNFIQNQAEGNGGAMVVAHSVAQASTPLIRQTIFCRNSAGQQGGAIYIDQALPKIVNCTLYANQAQGNTSGGAICVEVPVLQGMIPVIVRNCILWENDDVPFATVPLGYTGDALDVTYCNFDVDYSWHGPGNINEDPFFASTWEGQEDFHIESSAGRWSPDERSWVFDGDPEDDSSPCIDAGDPNDPVGAEGQPHGNCINMGAYGGTMQASKGAGRRVFHVDQAQGSDSNSGSSLEDAFATISAAVKVCRESGDAVLVWPGVYEEQVFLDRKSITIQSAADAAICRAPAGYSAFNYYYSEGKDCILRNFIITGSQTNKAAITLQNSSPTLEQLTIVNNYVGIHANEAYPDIHNCIFWDNIQNDLQDCVANYSCLRQADVGEGNINRDPLFVDPDPDHMDCHLKSRYGRYWGEYNVWVVDSVTSNCIDAGDPADFPLIERQENGGRLNMGAYGGTYYASLSTPYPSADLNRDGFVDFLDLALLADSWLQYLP